MIRRDHRQQSGEVEAGAHELMRGIKHAPTPLLYISIHRLTLRPAFAAFSNSIVDKAVGAYLLPHEPYVPCRPWQAVPSLRGRVEPLGIVGTLPYGGSPRRELSPQHDHGHMGCHHISISDANQFPARRAPEPWVACGREGISVNSHCVCTNLAATPSLCPTPVKQQD